MTANNPSSPRRRLSHRWIGKTLFHVGLAGIDPDEKPSSSPLDDAVQRRLERAQISAFCTATTKVIFVFVPLLIIAIALGEDGKLHTIFKVPEWSILAIVLNGETIVALSSSVLGRKVLAERFLLVLSVFIVLMFIPNMMALMHVLAGTQVSRVMQVWQLTMFMISAFMFWMASFLHSTVRQLEYATKPRNYPQM